MKNKWIILGIAIMITAINLLNADLSSLKQLSASDLLPVILIALISFIVKTGVLSAMIIGIKNFGKGFSPNNSPGIALRNSGFCRLKTKINR